MIYSEDRFRPKPTYPVYPPYHTGEYIEDYFYSNFVRENVDVSRDYIAISWTTLYCENKDDGLQTFLDSLPAEGRYFTVCQHDDAPRHILPRDTLIFSLSQATPRKDVIQIPAVCSPVPEVLREDPEIFASFVGSLTHRIRNAMRFSVGSPPKYQVEMGEWSPTVSEDKLLNHLRTTKRSRFTLCPRGYGNTSFRMYEAMQLGSVPVYMSDDFCLPWSDELDWDKLAILVTSDRIHDIEGILDGVSQDRYNEMLAYTRLIYPQYFTLPAVCNQIIRRVI